MTYSISEIETMLGEIDGKPVTTDDGRVCDGHLLTMVCCEFPKIISSLLAKLKIADAALEFYADEKNFSGGNGETVMENFKQKEDWDGLEPIGTRARQAREEIK